MSWSARAHLRLVKKDGVVTAPVWFHHLFKMLTSAGVAWLLLAVFSSFMPIMAAVVAGPVTAGLTKVVYIIWPKLSHDPATYGFAERVGDWIVDVTLGSWVVVLAILQEAQYGEGPGRGVAAGLGLALAIAYWACLPHSRP